MTGDTHRIRYTDGTTNIVVTVPWGLATGWIPPGTIAFRHETHGTRWFVYDGTTNVGPTDHDAERTP